MVIVLRPDVSEAEFTRVLERVKELGLTPHVSRGETRTIIGCIGDEDRLRDAAVLSLPGVETVLPVEKPYKLASREFAARATVVPLGEASVGGAALAVIAGPCSVEGRDMLLETARAVRGAGEVALFDSSARGHFRRLAVDR
jgi:3-deoxy-7-phosphoheptulonate synthase